jgi:WD40 repeat protein
MIMSEPVRMALPFRRSLAIVAGIDAYTDGIPPLRTAVNDARRLAAILEGHHGYDVRLLLDGDATRAGFTRVLREELCGDVGPDDRVVFYFAGHGVALQGDDGPQGYLLPVDARRADPDTYLHMPALHEALVALPCRHMLVVLDACFAGAFRWSGTRDIGGLPKVIHRERFDRFVSDPAWQVITSAAQDQRALDSLSTGSLGTREERGEHSPFALALFAGLTGAADVVPREGGDGVITATELYLYLEEQVQASTIHARRRQTPRLWPLSKHDKGEFVFLTPGREPVLPPAPPLTDELNPWRGLSSYEGVDEALFFGRTRAIESLSAAVESNPLTVVLGASGTGKSSLVKAGLVPRLSREPRWRIAPEFRPGRAPLEALAKSLRDMEATPSSATPMAIAEALQRWCAGHPTERLAIIVDQAEELSTMALHAAERDTFLQILASFLERHPAQGRVVLTLRSDFEPQLDQTALARWWRESRFVVAPLSRAELREVIERPATVRVLYFDPPTLVDALIDEVVATPGGLPLLSFALSEMYLSRLSRAAEGLGDRALDTRAFDEVGGVLGALRSRANMVYDALDLASRETMRRLALRMVSGDAMTLTRRRVPLTELVYDDQAENARIDAVRDELVEARLVVRGSEPDGRSYVEPAHDALVTAWDRLVSWVREATEEAVPLVTRQKLAASASEWRGAPKRAAAGLLWSDAARNALLDPLVRQRARWLNRDELAFAKASVRRRRLRLAAILGAAAVVAVLGAASGLLGVRAARAAGRAQRAAILSSAAGETDATIAAGLLVSLAGTEEPERGLAVALDVASRPRILARLDGRGGVRASALSPDADLVAMVDTTGKLRLWRADGAGSPVVWTARRDNILSVAFHPDGKTIGTGSTDGIVRLSGLDGVVTDSLPADRELSRPAPARLVAFAPTGDELLIGSGRHRLGLWNLANRGVVARWDAGSGPAIASLSFDPSGARIIVSDENEARVWGFGPRREPDRGTRFCRSRFQGQERTCNFRDARFSPDGHRIVVASSDGSAYVFDPTHPDEPLAVLRGHESYVNSAAFSPDGNRIVTTSDDHTVRLWSAVGADVPLTLRGHRGPVTAAEFSVDGSRMITTSADGTVLVWSVGLEAPTPLLGHEGIVESAVFGPTPHTLLTASGDHTARLWRLDSATSVRIAHDAQLTIAAQSRDGRWIVTGTRDMARGAARLFRAGSQDRPTMLGSDHAWGVRAAEISDDTTHVLTTDGRGTLRVWTRDGTLRWRREGAGEFARFSPDGHHIASWTVDARAVRIWSIEKPESPVVLTADTTEVTAVAFSPDGRHVATGWDDGVVRVWPSGGGTPLVRRGHQGRVLVVAFSRDGSRLASGAADGTARIWPADSTQKPVVMTGIGQGAMQIVFSADGGRVLTIADNGALKLWDRDGIATSREIGTGSRRPIAADFTDDGSAVLVVSRTIPGAEQSDRIARAIDPSNPSYGPLALHRVELRWDSVVASLRRTSECLAAESRVHFLGEDVDAARAAQAQCERARREDATRRGAIARSVVRAPNVVPKPVIEEFDPARPGKAADAAPVGRWRLAIVDEDGDTTTAVLVVAAIGDSTYGIVVGGGVVNPVGKVRLVRDTLELEQPDEDHPSWCRIPVVSDGTYKGRCVDQDGASATLIATPPSKVPKEKLPPLPAPASDSVPVGRWTLVTRASDDPFADTSTMIVRKEGGEFTAWIEDSFENGAKVISRHGAIFRGGNTLFVLRDPYEPSLGWCRFVARGASYSGACESALGTIRSIAPP